MLDVNDHRPVFESSSYEFEMREDLRVGASVGAVYATDDDVGENAELVFAITSQTTPFHFYIDSLYLPQAGVIRVLEVSSTDEG